MSRMLQTQVNVRGLSDLSRSLRELGEGCEKRVLAAAVRKAAAHVLDLVKQKAPRGSGMRKNVTGKKIGHMADSLIVQQKQKGGQVTSTIGSYTHGALLHLVEFGTAPHAQPRLNREHPGTRARPFMRPAIDEGGQKAVDAFADEMEKGLAREAKKAARLSKLGKALHAAGALDL